MSWSHYPNYESTVVTTDNIVHEVYLEGKRIGHVIKTQNKETPFTVVDIDGPSGNVKTLNEGVKKMSLVHIGKNLPAEKKAAFLATLIAMKLKGEI
ncbi:hypothetical protein H5Q83_15455 [Escherichia coli]|uniref:hypothetical protein n=1 Tax=Escherichia coli TaxID=562 RepID=UPI001D3B6795|nr:hypothetical protein [Escherichia coli]MBZ8370420.1 hypothetical protein [Escherichia coli]MCW3298771.1 hypothetical protein [Escherichia coli]